MIMTVLLFATHFFKRKNTYRFLFSTAISEGIKDLFNEMGYGRNGVSKKENIKNEMISPSDPALEAPIKTAHG
jgi:hypothetical protein